MNLEQMQAELGMIVQDASLQSRLVGWINDAILAVATDYDLPPLALVEPYLLSVDTSKWLWPLPESFHKHLFLVQRADTTAGPWSQVQVCKNPAFFVGQDHTLEGGGISAVTVFPQGKDFMLGVHPLADQELNLWFYRKPDLLVNAGDVCDCIPFNFVSQVIYPKVIIKNYQFIVDQVIDFSFTQGPFQYWQGELMKGLNGARGQGTGLIGYFNLNFHPPRRTGGRDPIGGRPYRGSF